MTIIHARPTSSEAIPTAIRRCAPGDTVEIHAGRYPAFAITNLNGRWGRRITIQATPGERVVIDAGMDGGHPYHCIHGRQSGSYFTLRNLTLTDSSPYVDAARQCDIMTEQGIGKFRFLADRHDLQNRGGIRLNGYAPFHKILVEQCHIHHIPSYGISGMVTSSTFQNNRIHDLGSPGEGYGMYFWRSAAAKIRHNTIYDCAGWGLTTAGMRRSHVHDNVFANPVWPYYHYETEVVKGEDRVGGIAPFSSGVRNCYQRNRLYGGYWGIRLSPGEQRAIVNQNELFGNHTGIYVAPGNEAKLSGNRTWDNVVDVVLASTLAG